MDNLPPQPIPTVKNMTSQSHVFPELATSLYYFIAKLHSTLIQQGIDRVYFLSREGQPLKRLFDRYVERAGGTFTSHYLEVSRRSTLLPSLAALDVEHFNTLFRQYRRISLLEFLSSLGLETHTPTIAQALNMGMDKVSAREADFPTSATFSALLKLDLFQSVYENERIARRSSFQTYLQQLSGGHIPSHLVIVDVGWKGTIQDHLFSMLCTNCDTPVDRLTGYYIGLVAEGAAGPHNTKHGLLFSTVGEETRKFRVFNENRALFEILLAADHGSVISYECNAEGEAYPVHDDFAESEMIASAVVPVQRKIFTEFEQLLSSSSAHAAPPALPFNEVVKRHARMVFNPTADERRWFTSVFHLENYGVFEKSHFQAHHASPGIFQRLHFLAGLFRPGNQGLLGFWPLNTLRERGGLLPAKIYAVIRQLQN